ncbi:MAG: hypothetical protein IPP46_18130 [Bacteroidetes bacterium]|nr:hypothetical protein [Bacteroidota bacterium]
MRVAEANKNDKNNNCQRRGNLKPTLSEKEDPATAYNYFDTSLEAAKGLKVKKQSVSPLLQCFGSTGT